MKTQRYNLLPSTGLTMIVFISVVVLACTSHPKSLPAETLVEEGFLDADTFVAKGYGVSPENMRNPSRRLQAAQQSARMDADRRFLEICVASGSGECGRPETEVRELRNLLNQISKTGVPKSNDCKNENSAGSVVGCRVLIEYKYAGLRQRCAAVGPVATCM